ncbi:MULTISPECIES: class I SAM-dependent methyltransferase [unclassified Streptomyces]|uniref:class I SAM-dependent methyltransferase n=1 Tax=unclassified Streptomyces TaxID=2593676 RepID=UPI001BEC0FFA|nr:MULTISPECIES: class I SAM-dependent methyltransferase [unclassified Streptomyces]MBT2407639.1 class I SAM-dependent methyltransferase [Streptomyces sp. ISL-21]MBT2454516.1 class I SAM-dependent methyltransferase [Streptomyces sp. ISL-86]MBT2611633.1 class I SAM-dependent methyltransferase [Streptomyces sp. ISL-87]
MEFPELVINSQQAQAWNGTEGSFWARHQDQWDAVNDGFNQRLLDAADIVGHHQVLDIGCGAGHATRLAARRATAGMALGLDLSGPMLERARAAADRERLPNVEFTQGDAQVHPLPAGVFDRAISRFGVMFFADPVAAFGHIGQALRPGGRLAFVTSAAAADNDWAMVMSTLSQALPEADPGDFGVTGAPGMFSLADPARIRAVLDAAGFTGAASVQVEAQGDWGPDAAQAADFLLSTGPAQHLLAQAATAQRREEARRTLTAALRPFERDGAVRLRSTAWLVTADRPRS